MEKRDTNNIWTCYDCGTINGGAECQTCNAQSIDYIKNEDKEKEKQETK